MCYNTVRFIIYQLFGINIEIIYCISLYMPFRGIFLAEISPTFVKIIKFVSMATMEATWLLGTFQLLNHEGY